MSNENAKTVAAEVTDLFVGFFRDNLDRLSRQLPSMIVDGTAQWYPACLPENISSKVRTENQNHV